MPYTVSSESIFEQKSQGQRNFDQLYQDPNWKASATNWGIAELYASRALCMSAKQEITPLLGFYSRFDHSTLNSHLKGFIDGFPNMNDLAWMSEPQLVRISKSDGLGNIWATVGAFLRREQFAVGVYGPSQPPQPQLPQSQPPAGSSRPIRQAAVTAQANIQAMSAAGTRHQEGRVLLRSTLSTSPSLSTIRSSSGSLLGYTEPVPTPLVEDATVHLVSSVVRFLLNFKQPPSKPRPLTWRDEKIMYRYSCSPNQIATAADDGGLQIWTPGNRNFRQIALLEAKRVLKNVRGMPGVADEVLAQMVAQAIALQRTGQTSTYIAARQNVSITILATNRFVCFYAFEFGNDYFQNYENCGMGSSGCHVRIHRTKWMDITVKKHREQLLLHLSAILAWADSLP